MKKILIIEDDPVIQRNTVEFLKEEGFDVYFAHHGAEGVQIAMQEVPDLIVCDINMPKMNGYEVLKTLQSLPSSSNIPFIFLTAKVQNTDQRLGMQLGADDYITKPFNLDDLLQSIKIRFLKMEKNAQATEKNIQQLIQTPLLGVFIYKNNRFTFANDKLCKMAGYTTEEFQYLGLAELIEFPAGSDKEITITNCIKGIAENIHLEINIKSKKNQLIKGELFGTSLKINNQWSFIGNFKDDEAINNLQKFIKATRLSERELEILCLICQGLSSKLIADKLCLSQRTVDSHRANLMSKTQTRNTAELTTLAAKHGLISSR